MTEIKVQHDRVVLEMLKDVRRIILGGTESREWLVLGSLRELLMEANAAVPCFAEREPQVSPPAKDRPDFLTFDADGTPQAYIEITEAMRPSYRPNSLYRTLPPKSSYFLGIPPQLSDPWSTLRERIVKKANLEYPVGTTLLVYLNVSRLCIHDGALLHEELLVEHSRRPFLDFEAFGRVLIMGSDMGSLIQLYPDLVVIVPDDDDPLSSRNYAKTSARLELELQALCAGN